MAIHRRRVGIQSLTVFAAVVGVLGTNWGATWGTPGRSNAGGNRCGSDGRRLPSTTRFYLAGHRGGAVGGREEGFRQRRSHSRRRRGGAPTTGGGISGFLRSVIGRGETTQTPAVDESNNADEEDDARRNRASGLKQISLPDLNVENFLRIDFSGDLDCHILGHSHHSPLFESASSLQPSFASASGGPRRDSGRSSTAALIRSQHPWTPNWIVGLHYDFARCWYGATRAWSNVQFVLFPPPLLSSTPVIHPRMLLPAAFDWTTDRAIRDGKDRMNEATLQWRRSVQDRASTCLRGRVESTTAGGTDGGGAAAAKAALTLQVPLHRRLSYECRVVSDSIPMFLQNWSWLSPSSSSTPRSSSPPSSYSGNSNSRPTRGFRLPDVTRLDDDGWWLPDVTLSASGHIESRNVAVLPHPTRLYDGRLAVRFTIRRSLLWNRADEGYHGGIGDGEDEDESILLPSASPVTTVGLEVHDIQSHAMNGVKLQTELERPLHALRVAFVQQLYRRS